MLSKENLTAIVSEALGLQRQKHWERAETLYKEVLAAQSDHADALHLYGCLCDSLGRVQEATALIERATQSNPQAYPYFYNLGNLLVRQDKTAESIDQYRKAIAIKPDYAVAHNNLGIALRKQGDRAGAKRSFSAAVRFAPNYADAHYNLGLEWRAVDDLDAAIACYQTAIRLKPDYADALYAMGNAYSSLNRLEEAKNAYVESLRAQSNSAKTHTNIGSVYMRLGRLELALASFETALHLDPKDAFNRSNLILTSSYVSTDPAETFKRCQEWDQCHGLPADHQFPAYNNNKEPARRLRIGYVSADFRSHAAAYWIEPVLAAHQHDEFEVFCYSNSNDADDVTERLRKYADHWLPCATFSADEFVDRIRSDAIDILVDLSGHTEGNRLTTFVQRPAPIQVSWFGFPVSTGLKSIQYRFTDSNIDPSAESDDFNSEKLVKLSRFYAAFKPHPDTPDPGRSPFKKNQYITFAAFNSFAKVTDEMLGVWAEILLAVPQSRLLLQAAGMDGRELGTSIKSYFLQKGVATQRIELRGWTGLADYLKLGQEADIALDPYPFNGGVTTCHALWMGLPVVTMRGRSAASRVGNSILTTVGLTELIADTPNQYREIAVGLATQLDHLEAMREGMRERLQRSKLLDGKGLTQEVEQAFRQMWLEWCKAN
jgi:protein O-GlcNAc transferase